MNIDELTKKRAALEAELPERKIEDLDAQIAAAKLEEQAAADREHARLVAEARAAVGPAFADVRRMVERTNEALMVLAEKEAAVLSLGEHDTGARVNGELRATVRAQVGAWVLQEERDREAAIPESEKRRKFLEDRIEFESGLLAEARKGKRDTDAYRLEKSIASYRAELGLPTPIGEVVRQVINPTRVRAEVEDQTAMEHHLYWAAKTREAREAEAKKAAGDAPIAN
jgi:hypothetical protein